MEVILLENVDRLGQAGEKVKVKDGFGRNYLIPQKKALLATQSAVKVYEQHQRMKEAQKNKARRHAEHLAAQIEKISITAPVQVGEDNKLFGSVTSLDIHRLMAEQNLEIDKRLIGLDEPLKELGVYTVPIKLHSNVQANLKVWVVKA